MVFDIINRVPDIDSRSETGKNLDRIEGRIEFKDVNFRYPSRLDQQVLNNFSAVFEPGQTTAIVGPSGSGKSTIVQLIERFYDPESGSITVDGVDLKSLNLKDFRKKIGYVGQEPVLFNETIKQNILLGNPDATNEQIWTAIENANAKAFIKDQHDLDAGAGSSGTQLSGGQK